MNKTRALIDDIVEHCNESMERSLLSERYPSWKRSCPEVDDIDFIRLELLRSISTVDSGCHSLPPGHQVTRSPDTMAWLPWVSIYAYRVCTAGR